MAFIDPIDILMPEVSLEQLINLINTIFMLFNKLVTQKFSVWSFFILNIKTHQT